MLSLLLPHCVTLGLSFLTLKGELWIGYAAKALMALIFGNLNEKRG